MLKLTNFQAKIDGKDFVRGLTLTMNAGEMRAITGPNGGSMSVLSGPERRR